MIKEEVHKINGEGRVDSCKGREKVGLERFYGTLSGFAAVDIHRDKLELDLPILLNDAPIVSTGFVVGYFKSTMWPRALRRFMMKEFAAMWWVSFLVWNGNLEDRIRVTVVGDHNVLISVVRANGEAAGVICIKISYVIG